MEKKIEREMETIIEVRMVASVISLGTWRGTARAPCE